MYNEKPKDPRSYICKDQGYFSLRASAERDSAYIGQSQKTSHRRARNNTKRRPEKSFIQQINPIQLTMTPKEDICKHEMPINPRRPPIRDTIKEGGLFEG